VFNIDRARRRIKGFQREWFARTKRRGLSFRYAPDRFIADFDYALVQLADPKDIVARTVRMLG